jgi:uncharacterized protein YabN with tetrapyrrole methylase and pyrophosphatase domain
MADALSEARRIQLAASSLGFDWPGVSGALAKLREEIGELDRAVQCGQPGHQGDELGDVLFSAVNVSRFIGVDASEALAAANRKFSARFERVQDEVRKSGRGFGDYSLDELDGIWDRVKTQTGLREPGSGARGNEWDGSSG